MQSRSAVSPSRLRAACCVLTLCVAAACGTESVPGRRVGVQLALQPAHDAAATRDFTGTDGWSVHLDEARVMLGPIYLRAPKRSVAWQWLLPRAHAHAQTLQDTDVVGEYLGEVAYDALGGPLMVGGFESADGLSDALSVVLAAPRTPDAQAQLRGSRAFVRGFATRGAQRIDFACGLRIDGAVAELPQNLEARRRVDRVPVEPAAKLDAGARLTLFVDVQRWLELVRFDDLTPGADACASPSAPFLAQWYLGIRRPEAFRAEIAAGAP